jgi:hypothetical protein
VEARQASDVLRYIEKTVQVCGGGCEREGKMSPLIIVGYIHLLIDEYRWVVPVSPTPPIFVDLTTSPMNIGHVYSSMTCTNQQIYGVGQKQPPLYSSVPMNEPSFHFM